MKQTTSNIKTNYEWRFSKWLTIFIITLLIIVAIHFNFYVGLKKEFHASESVNPKATSYFLHASAITVSWINILHSSFGVSYDNPIMKPIISIRDYYFNLGEKYVNEDNAEDAIWWSYNYSRLYGFAIGDDDNVYSIQKLDKNTQRELRNKMYNYIIKLGNHVVKGIYSKENTDPLKDMTDLVSGYILEISKMYEGKTGYERSKNFYSDEIEHKKLIKIYEAYSKVSNGSHLAIDKKNYHDIFRFRILQYIIFGEIYKNNRLSQSFCSSIFVEDYLKLFNQLTKWSKSQNKAKTDGEIRLSNLFISIALSSNPNKISTQILVDIEKECKNYPEASKFLELKKGRI